MRVILRFGSIEARDAYFAKRNRFHMRTESEVYISPLLPANGGVCIMPELTTFFWVRP